MPGAGLKTPKLVTVSSIEREEVAFRITGEHEIAGCSQHGRQQDELVRHAPDALSGDGIPGIDVAVGCPIRREFYRERAIHEVSALDGLIVVRRDIGADFIDRRINETGSRRI